MKAKILILAVLALSFSMTAAYAQDYVSITELYDQAKAMGGVWRETFDTPNGEMTVDAPVIVPDVEKIPVLTVEQAKISEELFNTIRQGKKGGEKGDHRYETELDGETIGFFLGRDNEYIYGTQTDRTGYDAIHGLWMYHGGYLPSLHTGMGSAEKRAEPTTYHYPWELDPDAVCVRNTDITLREAMRLWQEDITLCYPGEEFTIQPTRIKLRGSILETDSKERNKRDGYLVVDGAVQIIEGVPLMGMIGYGFDVPHVATRKTNIANDKMNVYRVGCDAVFEGFYGNFTDEGNYRTCSSLARTRTIEHTDVPLAPLDRVLESVRKEIEAGNIRRVHSVKLGYILYSNPDMTDYAWAVPRWKVEVDYVSKEEEKRGARYPEEDPELAVWERFYYTNLPIDAQSGEAILFTTGDEETFSVPKLVTWDEL